MPIKKGNVINVNIPELSKGEPKGIKVVPQSCEGFEEYYIPQKNEQGQTVFQLAGNVRLTEKKPTDIISLSQGYITITALASDMTNHGKQKQLEQIGW